MDFILHVQRKNTSNAHSVPEILPLLQLVSSGKMPDWEQWCPEADLQTVCINHMRKNCPQALLWGMQLALDTHRACRKVSHVVTLPDFWDYYGWLQQRQKIHKGDGLLR